jgi:hypothetical protein
MAQKAPAAAVPNFKMGKITSGVAAEIRPSMRNFAAGGAILPIGQVSCEIFWNMIVPGSVARSLSALLRLG